MDQNFDWLESYRDTFASVHKAQEQGLKAIERFARFQYAVAGDYLEAGLAHTQAALAARSPAELLSKQSELGARLSDKLRTRAQEFSAIASEVQGNVTTFANDTAHRAAASASAKKAA